MRRLSDLNPGFIIFAILGWMFTFLPAVILIGGHPRGEPYTADQLPGLIYTTFLLLVWAIIWLSPFFSSRARTLVLSPQGASRSVPMVIVVPASILILLSFFAGSSAVTAMVGV